MEVAKAAAAAQAAVDRAAADDAASAAGAEGGGQSLVSGQSTALASKGSTAAERTVADLEQLIDRPAPGQECYICKVRQPGCPLCWDFPVWKRRKKRARPAAAPGRRQQHEEIEAPVAVLCPADYAFVPGGEDPRLSPAGADVEAGGDLVRPALHTALTTHTSLRLFRNCFMSFTTYNVKTVPSGDIVSLVIDNDSTVFGIDARLTLLPPAARFSLSL